MRGVDGKHSSNFHFHRDIVFFCLTVQSELEGEEGEKDEEEDWIIDVDGEEALNIAPVRYIVKYHIAEERELWRHCVSELIQNTH